MKIFLISINLLIISQLFGQRKITTLSELQEWNAKEKSFDSLKKNFNGKDYIDSLLFFLNEYRIEYEANPIILTENLCKVAQLQAQYCADNLILTHDQSDEFLSNVFERGLIFNERNVIAEIAQEGHFDILPFKNGSIPFIIIENFKSSRGHAQIMRDEEYLSCGISLIQSKKDTNLYYIIIVFSTD